MKKSHAALLVTLCAIASGCAYVAPGDGAMRRVSADYTASGAASGTRAYLYGNRTILEIPIAPAMVLIRDDNGKPVEFERMGNLYRLAGRIDRFTVWSNGSSMTFVSARSGMAGLAPANTPELVKTAVAESIPTAVAATLTSATHAAIAASDASTTLASRADVELTELVRQAQVQIDAARRLLVDTTTKITPHAQQAVQAQIDKLEKLLVTGATATLGITFASGSTNFSPSDQQGVALVNAAQAAERVRVSGYTDATIAGPSDARIALGRAQGAKDYLIAHGIDKEKVSVSSQKDGAHIATTKTAQGRALNRRVEFQFTNHRIADISKKSTSLIAAK